MSSRQQVILFLCAVALGAIILTHDSKAANIPKACNQYRTIMSEAYPQHWAANLAAQVWAESHCNKDAQSPYAHGLSQFTPPTANDMCGWYNQLCPVDMYNPRWSITAQTLYMQRLYKMLKAHNKCDKMAFALSAYNGGAGWTLRDKKETAKHGKSPFLWFGNVELYADKRRRKDAIKENKTYPNKILQRFSPVVNESWQWEGLCDNITTREIKQ